MSVQNILDRKGTEVFTVDPTATVRTAAQLMRARGIAALVVKTADLGHRPRYCAARRARACNGRVGSYDP